MTIRIVVVDDQEMYRLGFRAVLESLPELEVVGETDDGDTAVELLRTVQADVVLMDVRMPGMDGVEATRRIRASGGPQVLVLTTFDLDEYAYDALEAGASGFLLKNATLKELSAAIAHVHRGDAVVDPTTARRLIDRFAGGDTGSPAAGPPGGGRPDGEKPTGIPAAEAGRTGTGTHERGRGTRQGGSRGRPPELARLTPREREVLVLIGEGLSNGEIAAHMGISENTVRVHGQRVLTKLELRDRVQAVVLAHRWGLVG